MNLAYIQVVLKNFQPNIGCSLQQHLLVISGFVMSASMFECFDKDSLPIISSTSCILVSVLELS